MEKRQHRTIQFLLFLLSCISIYPLFKIGFVSGDDLEYFLTADPVRWMSDAKIYAEGTGRFYFYLVKWIYSVPYLIDSAVYYYFCFITPILTTFILFIWLIKRVCNNNTITYIGIILTNSFLVYFAKHSAITAYPLYFTLSLTLIFTSLHFYITYIKTRKYKFIIISAIIFGFATLFYECYLVYYFLFLFLILMRYSIKEFFGERGWKRATKEFMPYLIIGFLYILTYFIYYSLHKSGYSGNQVASDLTFGRMMKTLIGMSVNGLPFVTFFDYKKFFIEYALSPDSVKSYLFLTLQNISILAYTKGIIVGFLIYLLKDYELPKISKRVLFICLVISSIFIFLPHLPLAFSEKYTSYVHKTYITTSFTFFSVIILLVTLYLFISSLNLKSWIQKGINFVMAALVVMGAIVVQYTNERVTDDMKVSQHRFELIDALFTKANVKDGTPVFIAALHNTGSYFCKGVTYQSSPFAHYIHHQNGVIIEQYLDYDQFYATYNKSDKQVILVNFSQEKKRGDAYLALSYLRGDQLESDLNQNLVDSAVVGYFSPYKTFRYHIESDTLYGYQKKGIISNKSELNTQNGNSYIDKSRKITIFKFKGKNIKSSSLIISNQVPNN